jgi:DNA-binding HxlR family transcriptional regulator
MQRIDFADMPCPVARSLARVGERWNILILRDAYAGMTRFDEFRRSLDIAPNILTRRLADLVDAGMLEKVAYTDKPVRHEYVLTPLARDFRPVLLAMVEWGNKHFSPEGPALRLVARATGAPVVLSLVDSSTDTPVQPDECEIVAGPAATPGVRHRLAFAARKRAGLAGDERYVPLQDDAAGGAGVQP